MTFSSDLNKFTKKTEKKATNVFRKASQFMFGRIIKASPVGKQSLWIYNRGTKDKPDYVDWLAYNDPDGYVGGRFRANWQTSINRPKTKEVDSTSAQVATTTAIRVTKLADIGDSIWFINNLPYAQRLENGWSTQRPYGMVKANIKAWKSIVTRLAKAENKK